METIFVLLQQVVISSSVSEAYTYLIQGPILTNNQRGQ